MGYITENEISRMYRNSRMTSIGGGADEIMLGMVIEGHGCPARANGKPLAPSS